MRVLSANNAFPSTGRGMEVIYDPWANLGVLQAYDRDYGSYQPLGIAGSTLSFYSSEATLQMYLDENGNLGIHTTSPAATLDVEGDGRFTGPVHLEPQGDLDMGQFTYDPNSSGGGGSDAMMSGGGGSSMGRLGGGGGTMSSGSTSGSSSH